MIYVTDEQYEIAARNGISKHNVNQRVYNYDYDVERAITEPLRKPSTRWQQWKEIALAHGISNEAFNSRIARGMPEEEAATRPIGTRPSKYNTRKKREMQHA
jgi:hypothetical protein